MKCLTSLEHRNYIENKDEMQNGEAITEQKSILVFQESEHQAEEKKIQEI